MAGSIRACAGEAVRVRRFFEAWPPLTLLALGWIALMVIVALGADFFAPYSFTALDLRARLHPPVFMLKIGQLVLTGGVWNGKQVVPADWIKRATTPVVEMPRRRGGYGYHWYTGAFQDATHPPLPWIAGIGWGGQRLYVIPRGDLVVGINCGNYRRTGDDQHIVGVRLVTELVLPTLA